MSDMPERIWAWSDAYGLYAGGWTDEPDPPGTDQAEYHRAPVWQPIETAPKNCDILVWYDHDADPYQDPSDPNLLTDYAAWCEGVGSFLEPKGVAIARWQPSRWEATDEYGGGCRLPAWWFARENDDYERPVNPIYWQPLPSPPENTQ